LLPSNGARTLRFCGLISEPVNVEVVAGMALTEDPNKSTPQPKKGENDEGVGMEELLKLYDQKMAEITEGEIVRGRVVQVTPSEIVVDIGYKSEGILSIDEVRSPSGEVTVQRGDEIDVFVERVEGTNGYVSLSREKAARVRVWDNIEEAFKNGEPVTGRVLDRVKGGLAVDVGVKAFLPGSLVDTKPLKNLDVLKGKELAFKVISFDRKRNNVVLSRRAIVEVEQEGRKKQTFQELQEGKLTHGVVKNITDYGVFVDLGGVDGLLHITDISWGRVNHPSEYFNVGDEIEVVVLRFDPQAERVSLGYKQKTADPWLDVVERYPLGSKVGGRVVSLTDYGAFIELEEGVEGLVHVSEMSWTRRVRNPAKLLSLGDTVEAVVSDVNVANRRISLSLRALEENPWHTIDQRFPVGSVISGKVRNLTDFGAFVEVEEGIDGLIHVSDMAWNRRIKHPSEVLKKGDTVSARVSSVDPDNQRLSLSIKEFLPNEWDDFAKAHQVGEELIGTVSKVTDFGIFIRLSDGVEGLAHISEIDRDPRTKLDRIFNSGDPVRVRVIKIDWTEKKIGLSLRGVPQLTEDEIRELGSVGLVSDETEAGDSNDSGTAVEQPAEAEDTTAAGQSAEAGETPSMEQPAEADEDTTSTGQSAEAGETPSMEQPAEADEDTTSAGQSAEASETALMEQPAEAEDDAASEHPAGAADTAAADTAEANEATGTETGKDSRDDTTSS
jgi:small subunit ribosomal protein S1